MLKTSEQALVRDIERAIKRKDTMMKRLDSDAVILERAAKVLRSVAFRKYTKSGTTSKDLPSMMEVRQQGKKAGKKIKSLKSVSRRTPKKPKKLHWRTVKKLNEVQALKDQVAELTKQVESVNVS